MRSNGLAGCVLVISTIAVACTTGTTSGSGSGSGDGGSDGGTSGTPLATPRVTFESTISPGTHPAKVCPKTGTWFTIGSFGNPALGRVDPSDPESPLKDPVRPVDDGGDDKQGKVSVSCSVKASGDAFDVMASAQLTGAAGGAVTLSGTFGSAGDQSDITLSLTKMGETFSSKACVARFETAVGQAIAPGRLWVQVDCADAEQPSAAQVCKTSAQLRVENCLQ